MLGILLCMVIFTGSILRGITTLEDKCSKQF